MKPEVHNGQPGFYPLVNGMDALGARLDMIEKAEKSVDLQYYLMEDDTAGLVISTALIRAADRGVRVRFLLDDISASASERRLLLLDQHPNIEVRLFNPISRSGFYYLNFVASFEKANRRMHNKSITIDNSISIIGGRNIADEYYQLRDDSAYADFDILTFGQITKAISDVFDIYWNHALAVPLEQVTSHDESASLEAERQKLAEQAEPTYAAIYNEALSSTVLQEIINGQRKLFIADATVIADNPDKLQKPVGSQFRGLSTDIDQLLKSAESELILISPYYVPREDGVQYVDKIVEGGVRVVILTNSLASNDHTAVHAGYSWYREDVIQAGVELYELRADAGSVDEDSKDVDVLGLHTKLILVDRRYLFVGSLNLDPRSLHINAEMGLLIDSEELVGKMASGIDDILPSISYRVLLDEQGDLQWHGYTDGVKVVKESEPDAGLWRRFKAWFMNVAPESQL